MFNFKLSFSYNLLNRRLRGELFQERKKRKQRKHQIVKTILEEAEKASWITIVILFEIFKEEIDTGNQGEQGEIETRSAHGVQHFATDQELKTLSRTCYSLLMRCIC